MTDKLRVIYIPGIGDASQGSGQRKAVGFWQHYGVKQDVYEMSWADQVPWRTKFSQLLDYIDRLHADGHRIALVGVSAGASGAINAFAARSDKIAGVVCIAGKIHRPEAIGPRYRRNNLSFIESVEATEASLAKLSSTERQRILCRYALIDGIVARQDSKLAGAKNQLSPTVGHGLTIGFQITVGAPSLLRFLKRQ